MSNVNEPLETRISNSENHSSQSRGINSQSIMGGVVYAVAISMLIVAASAATYVGKNIAYNAYSSITRR